MTTINTLDDILHALDNNPSWREAVRVRILGEELLQLPARFNAFAERQEETNQRMEARMNRMDEILEELRRLSVNAEARMNRMESDISSIKGWFVVTRLKEFVSDFMEVMNCKLERVLERDEITEMSRRIANATPAEIQSFRRADMVVFAGDRSAGGAPVYLAVEASYTASKNDTERAERNARFLAGATGVRAIPVIVSVRNTREAADRIESGSVRWYMVEEHHIQAE